MQSPLLFCQKLINVKFKTRNDDILHFSSVCPSTEYTIKKLKTKKIPEFETIRTLTDDLLYTQHVLYNRYNADIPEIVLNNRVYISKIEKRLQTLLEKHIDLPDKSYPFRHTMLIKDAYDEIDNDWIYKTKTYLTKKARIIFDK